MMGIGLDRYTHVFSSRKINLDILLTLTEEDLVMIGLGPFGVRRKLLLAIETHKVSMYS